MTVEKKQNVFEKSAQTVTVIGFGRRFAATLLDGVLIAFLSVILIGLFGILSILVASFNPYSDSNTFNILFIASTVLVSVLYYVGMWIKSDGQTIGKSTLGIRIIRTDGSPLSVGRGLLRYVGYIINGIIFSLGFIWVAFDGKRQGWHDKLAGTYVINVDDTEFVGKNEVNFVQSDAGKGWIWIVIWIILALLAPALLGGTLFFLGPVINRMFG